MNISEPFIKRPVMTTLVTVGILFFGLLAYKELPISDLPDIDYPTIQVSAANPGSNAETMAATVATPLEQQFMTIPGIQQITSTSYVGQTQIVITFNLDRNIDAASTDVAAAINQAQGDLPPEMPNPPTYNKFNPSAAPVMFIAVSCEDMTLYDLYDYANTVIAQQISIVNGVSEVQVYGAQRAVRIKLDPDAMAYRGIGIDQVAQAAQNANQNQPAGQIYDHYQNLVLNPLGQMETGEVYRNLIVAYNNNAPIRIKDIGTAIDAPDVENFFINFWNDKVGTKPTIVLAVNKQAGFNTVALCQQIQEMIPKLQVQIPPSVLLSVIYDNSIGIEAAIWDVELTILIAFGLVVLVIFLFLGKPTATLIPSVTLPISMIGTCIAMHLCGYSVDILSTMAFTLVIGFLIDDALVVVENIVRHLDMGKPPIQAALDGSRQISMTVLSMTLSLSAVFIPLVFMPGLMGRMFHEFAMVIVISVLLSGFVSLTLTPMLSSRFLRFKQQPGLLERIALGMFKKMIAIYEPMLKWCLRHMWAPIILCLFAIVASGYFFKILPQDFLPPGDTGVIQGFTIAQQGVSSEMMAELQDRATEIVKKNPNIQNVISVANYPGATPNMGFIYSILKPVNQRQPINQVVGQLFAATREFVGLQCFFKPEPEINLDVGTSPARASYYYLLSTIEDPETLYSAVQTLTDKMKTLTDVVADVSNDIMNSNPQLNITIQRDVAATFGVNANKIEQAINLCFAQGQLATFSTPIATYQIIMQVEDKYRAQLSTFNKIYLTSNLSSNVLSTTGNPLVPLSAVVKCTETLGPETVNHHNQFTCASVYFNLAPGAALGTAINKIEALAEEILPLSVSRTFEGSAQAFQQTFGTIGFLLIIGILTIYLVLGMLYESFIHPLTILSALPGASFGALLTLLVFNTALSLYAYVGIIVLIGLVLKNGIMLVEFATELIGEGWESPAAIVEACKLRFRPILMTTVAAGMGAVPVALGIGGGEARAPLGMVIVGGLIFSQLITFFFTPVVFLLLQRVQERFTKKKQGVAKP